MKYLVLISALFMVGCGYSEIGTEAVGQVKQVVKNNPIICNGYTTVDMSLGVLQNGVGSMSTHDISLTVESIADAHTLTKAAETGKLVKITYDNKRVSWCTTHKIVTSVIILQ